MRSRNISFIPKSYNFSELQQYQIEEAEKFEDEIDVGKEKVILQSIYSMKNDKQRIVFFFEILKEYGYQFDCESVAKALGIQRRWYQRIKQSMRHLVQSAT
jgi:hypothetical protein